MYAIKGGKQNYCYICITHFCILIKHHNIYTELHKYEVKNIIDFLTVTVVCF